MIYSCPEKSQHIIKTSYIQQKCIPMSNKKFGIVQSRLRSSLIKFPTNSRWPNIFSHLGKSASLYISPNLPFPPVAFLVGIAVLAGRHRQISSHHHPIQVAQGVEGGHSEPGAQEERFVPGQ